MTTMTTTYPEASRALADKLNAELITCPNCAMTWAMIPGGRKAIPGRHVPTENQYGTTVTNWTSGGLRRDAMAPMSVEDDGASRHVTERWTCVCGGTLRVRVRAWETVPCRHGARPDDVCAKRAEDSAHDVYTNARYGGACECCGQQGSHQIPRGATPPCVTI